jgi:hypothetical protein
LFSIPVRERVLIFVLDVVSFRELVAIGFSLQTWANAMRLVRSRRRYARWRQAARQYRASGRMAKKGRSQLRHTRR